MSQRSPSIDRICSAALAHFSVHGYDASSLNEIATMVGIKKASLYTHFKNKDALFLEALDDAVVTERDHAEAVFSTASSSDVPGAAYVALLEAHHAESVHLRFLLRAAFHHPVALKTTIGQAYESFIATVQHQFEHQLRHAECGVSLTAADVARYAHAYIGIVESLFVELNFEGGAKMEVRREALWQVFRDSLAYRQANAG